VARARALGASTAGTYATPHNEAATRLALAHGFRQVSTNTLLRIGSDMPLPEPVFPAGYVLRPYVEVGDLPTLVRALTRGYEGLWGHHVISDAFIRDWVVHLRAKISSCSSIPRATSRASAASSALVSRLPTLMRLASCRSIARKASTCHCYSRPAPTCAVGIQRRWKSSPGGDTEETLAQYQTLGFALARKTRAYERSLA
jgi:hypothetical protein